MSTVTDQAMQYAEKLINEAKLVGCNDGERDRIVNAIAIAYLEGAADQLREIKAKL